MFPPISSAATRHSSIQSAANPRSRFVARRHVLTHVASACRVSTRLRSRTCAARLEKQFFHTIYESNLPLAGINTAQPAIEFVVANIFYRPSNQIALSSQRVINSLNRVEAIKGGTNPSQQTTAFQYDANGEAIKSTDPLGHATQTTLDALRRAKETKLPDGSVATMAFNQLGQLTQAIDPKGVSTQYSRNAWGEVLTETSPDVGQQTYTRDAGGNPLSMQDAKGQLTSYQYDALSRVTNITFADGKQQSFLYDGTATGQQIGSLREMQDASGNTNYERDSFARITKKIQTVNDNPANPTVLATSYAYTSAGQLAQITYPSGLNVFYRRNASGQITSIDSQKPRTSLLRTPAITPLVTSLQHTALNQPKSWSWNCVTGNLYTPTAQANCDAASRTFDQDGRITATEFSTLSYDAASRITGITQSLWAERTVTQVIGTQTTIVTELYQTPFTWQAGYDSRNRLIGFNRAGSEQAYTYDANSNRLTSIAKKVSDTDIDGIFEASDRAATTAQLLNIEQTSNKLLGFNQSVLTQATAANGTRRTISNVISAVNYQLDANGNLVSDGLRSFEYNAENRLNKVEITKDGEAAKITYLHNAQGQRAFKSEPQAAQTLPNEQVLGTTFTDWLKKNFQWLYANAQTNATLGTSYSYGEAGIPSWAMTGQYGNGGTSSTGRTEYIWLPTANGQAIPIGLYRSGQLHAIHTDHLGTPRLMVDRNNTPVWQWAYSAFGDNAPTGILKPTTNAASAFISTPAGSNGNTTVTLLATSTPVQINNLRFPGQYADSETGLFYNYFRTYDPRIRGGYIQPDPIGLAGGWNRFDYGYANALSFTDAMGLQPILPMPGGMPPIYPIPGVNSPAPSPDMSPRPPNGDLSPAPGSGTIVWPPGFSPNPQPNQCRIDVPPPRPPDPPKNDCESQLKFCMATARATKSILMQGVCFAQYAICKKVGQ